MTIKIDSSRELTGLCLQYLFILRILTIGGQIAALIVAHYLLAITPPIAPVAIIIPAISLFTLWSWRRLNRDASISELSVLIQLAVDVLGLTLLLFYTGGSANPFVSLLLLPVIVAAALLNLKNTWLIAGEAAICYTALLFIHVHPLSIDIHPPHWSHSSLPFTYHMWGMWLGFLLSAVVVSYFVAKMGHTLRTHDRELAIAREHSLQANQLVALGALAAGTAHELGTPLATMAVLAKEMEYDYEDSPELVSKLTVLREQIYRCKSILASMAERSGQARADSGRLLTIDQFLNETISEWQKLRYETMLHHTTTGSQPPPAIIADRTVTQAIHNVLNNAADAATSRIVCDANWTSDCLYITVSDDGEGLPDPLREHLGKPFVTTKATGKGLGLGLYLTNITLQRFGGRLELSDNPDHGVSAKISLPLHMLLATK